MTDIKAALREYLEASHPVTLEETIEGATIQPKLPITQRPRPLLVVVAAAVIVLVLVGGALLIGGPFSGDQTPVVTQPIQPSSTIPQATTTPSPDTTVPPPATVPLPVVGAWVRVPHDEDVFGGAGWQWMESVVTGGPGLVAVGYDTSGDGDAVVWTSSDAVIWTRVPQDEAGLGGVGRQWMWSVATGRLGLVAVGADCVSDSECDAAVWTSPDGVTWSREPHDEEIFGGGFMRSVTTGGAGFVAVGSVTTSYEGGSESDAAVWTSPDGVTWTRVAHDEAVFGGGGSQRMESVVVGGPGLVAVGADNLMYTAGDVPVYPSAAVWTSPDGVNWIRVPHDEAVFGGAGYQQMRSVVVGGPGLVAVGYDDRGSGLSAAAVWTSADGVTWTRVVHNEGVFGGDGNVEMESVVANSSGLVAVGYHWHLPGDDTDAAVWTSPDAVTWTRVVHDKNVFGDAGQQQMESVVVGGAGLVAVGIDATNTDVSAAVWSWIPGQQP